MEGTAEPTPKKRHVIRDLLFAILGILVLIQLIPYGHDHSNPPITQEPAWDSPETRALAAESCFDCHSNETTWDWYTNIAPFSWLAQHDVDEGRSVLNLSEWDRPQVGTDEIAEVIGGGGMPPGIYTLMHRGAKLSDTEQQQLIAGLEMTFRISPPIPGEGGETGEGGEGGEGGE